MTHALHHCRLLQVLTLALALSAQITPAHAQVEAITQPSVDLSLGFTMAGRVVEVLVDEGQVVEAGQPLAKLDDRAILARLELLRRQAQSELEIDARLAEWKLAQNEEARVRDAFEKDAAGFFEVERASLSTTLAEVRVELAREERLVAQARLAQAELDHLEATLLAPTSGVIELVAIEVGELVEPSRPVLRLVVIDPLRVDAPVPTKQTLGLSVGDEVPIQLDVPQFELRAPARIISIASVADPASDTRIVRLELPNPDASIPAGTGCVLLFDAAVSAAPE